MLASAVGGLLTRTLVSSQVECVTENASVYSFYMLMWLLRDFKAKLSLFLCFFFFLLPAATNGKNFCAAAAAASWKRPLWWQNKGATWLLSLTMCGICLICTLSS